MGICQGATSAGATPSANTATTCAAASSADSVRSPRLHWLPTPQMAQLSIVATVSTLAPPGKAVGPPRCSQRTMNGA
jgi:hypothetical protein